MDFCEFEANLVYICLGQSGLQSMDLLQVLWPFGPCCLRSEHWSQYWLRSIWHLLLCLCTPEACNNRGGCEDEFRVGTESGHIIYPDVESMVVQG